MKNLFTTPPEARPTAAEFFETVLTGPSGLKVERIISHGHATPEGTWYDQPLDEWVMVLQGTARLAYEDGSDVSLGPGDHVFLPRRIRHRVAETSSPCLWLAVHGDLTPKED